MDGRPRNALNHAVSEIVDLSLPLLCGWLWVLATVAVMDAIFGVVLIVAPSEMVGVYAAEMSVAAAMEDASALIRRQLVR